MTITQAKTDSSALLIRKAFPAEFKILDEAERIAEFVISSDRIDRDGDIIEAGGWEVEDYLANPVLMWAHDYRRPSIARALSLRIEHIPGRSYLVAVDQFAPAEIVEPELRGVWDLYREGYLRAASVGFIPKAWTFEIRESEGASEGDATQRGSRGYRFHRCELLEHSMVPVPANADALIRAKAAGLEVPERWLAAPGTTMVGAQVELRGRIFTVASTLPEDYSTAEGKPFANEHACRLRDPALFEADSFRRGAREHEGRRYFVIMGRLRGESTLTDQAFRYPKEGWPADQARAHCRSQGGTFEPASSDAAGACATGARAPEETGDEDLIELDMEPEELAAAAAAGVTQGIAALCGRLS